MVCFEMSIEQKINKESKKNSSNNQIAHFAFNFNKNFYISKISSIDC